MVRNFFRYLDRSLLAEVLIPASDELGRILPSRAILGEDAVVAKDEEGAC
jgi:hypothetical protein